METFGKKLIELRKEKKLSQIELAKKLDVGKSIISAWETDQNEPTLSNIRKIAIFFEVSADYLLGLTEY